MVWLPRSPCLPSSWFRRKSGSGRVTIRGSMTGPFSWNHHPNSNHPSSKPWPGQSCIPFLPPSSATSHTRPRPCPPGKPTAPIPAGRSLPQAETPWKESPNVGAVGSRPDDDALAADPVALTSSDPGRILLPPTGLLAGRAVASRLRIGGTSLPGPVRSADGMVHPIFTRP